MISAPLLSNRSKTASNFYRVRGFDSFRRRFTVFFVLLNADEPATQHRTGNARRAASHKWVNHNVPFVRVGLYKPLHQRQRLLR